MTTHKDLEVWNKSIDFVTEIYKITKDFPKEELYGITSQIRRASISISSNISEGAARGSTKEFTHFLCIAIGSIAETETQLIISKNLGYISDDAYNLLNSSLTDIRKMTLGLKKSLNAR
jgi:four helix bundle protein